MRGCRVDVMEDVGLIGGWVVVGRDGRELIVGT